MLTSPINKRPTSWISSSKMQRWVALENIAVAFMPLKNVVDVLPP